jgi:lipopolysaccharide export system protein LptA
MKRTLLLLLLASLVTPAVAQNDVEVGPISFEAKSLQREGSLTLCWGNVKVTTHSFILRADEVDYYWSTGIVEPRGNVRIQLLPVTPNTAPDQRQQPQ